MTTHPIKLIEDILKIYTPSGEEKELASYIVKDLARCGIDPEMDDAGNVIAEIGSEGPRILLCCHMDTVAGKLPVRKDGHLLYGRGAVDAKGPLVAMLSAFQELSESPHPPNIILACVVDEEGEGRGIREFLKERRELDYAVFGEPSGTDDLILGYKGMLRVSLRCTTKTGHSAAPWLYDNAVEEAFKIWRRLNNLEGGASDSRFHSLSSCLIKVEGGGEYSKVPDECRILIDFRIPPGLHPEQLLEMVKKEVERGLREESSLNVEVEGGDGVNAYESAADSVLVNAFSIAIRKVRGKQPVYLKKTGTSDINIMAGEYAIPIIAYGPGDSRLDHCEDEHIDVRDLLDSIEVFKEALMRLQSLHVKG